MPRPHESASLTRRNFLALSGTAAAAGALLSRGIVSPANAAETPAAPPPPSSKKYPIGLELYSVRGELAKDLPNTLRTVAKIGYEVVEFFSPYFAWTFAYAKDVRHQLDDLGLRCLSTHNNFPSLNPGTETMARAIELNQILGTRTIVMASPPPNTKTGDDWKRVCAQLTTSVGQLKIHGLTAGFHNHRIEWTPTAEGPRVMDIIAANTPPEFVLQFDVGTCMEAGADPIAWIKANPGRIKSVHLKDWTPGDKKDEKAYRVLFGEGVSPWKEIVATAEEVGGVEYYLLEQEGSRFSEFETAQRCLDSWRALRKPV